VIPLALFFDFDGTILDTESVEFTSINDTFQSFGATFDRDRWIACIGTSQPNEDFWIDWLETALGTSVDRAAVNTQQRAMKHDLLKSKDVRPGIIDLLETADDEGISCAVVSSSSRKWVESNIERLGLTESFTMLVTREDAPLAKPHPDLYYFALRRHDVRRDEAASVIAFEDSHNGSLASVRAGITTVTCPNDMTEGMDFAHSHHHVTSLATLDLDELSKLIGAR
jgi:HAD superfamily hydrolase (TIGR01509 family)